MVLWESVEMDPHELLNVIDNSDDEEELLIPRILIPPIRPIQPRYEELYGRRKNYLLL